MFCLFFFSSTQCNILCLKSLLNILQTHSIYKDVFREVGMLEVMVTCLHRYAALLKTPESEDGKILSYTVKSVLRGHLWDVEKVAS